MSTLIKNTLYRFKTARAPKKAKDDQITRGYVFPSLTDDDNNAYESSFLHKVSLSLPTTRKAALESASNTFESEAMTDINSLSETYPAILLFSKWLTAGKRTASDIDAHLDAGYHGPWTEMLSNNDKNMLFENLYYQIVSGKSPYLRDAIISLLAADFIHNWYMNNKADFLLNYVWPRVIVPKELFGITPLLESSIRPVESAQAGIKAATENILLQNHILQIDGIANEIKAFQKAHTKAVASARKSYDIVHKASTATAYANASKTARTVTDPVTNKVRTFTEYEGLELPAYEFEPVGELDYFMDQAKDDSPTKAFVEKAKVALGHETFADVLGYLADRKKQYAKIRFSENNLGEKRLSVGGTTVTQRNPFEGPDGTFSLLNFTNYTDNNEVIKLILHGIPSGTGLDTASYTVHYGDGETLTGTSFSAQQAENGTFYIDIFVDETFDIPADSFTITGEFFTRTREHKINIASGFCTISRTVVPAAGTVSPGNVSPVIGIAPIQDIGVSAGSSVGVEAGASTTQPSALHHNLTLMTARMGSTVSTVYGNGNFSYKTLNDNEEEIPDHSGQQNGSGNVMLNYIPSGYGIKRMGIADYRKVEQEICCYVPGEVSHIENVMAREYKEKSTRRLRRQEDTTTSSSETESEAMTDSTTTSRFEMNKEISSVLSEQQGISAGSEISWDGRIKGSVHADFANNTSSDNSDTLALSEAKEITERAMERVVRKVKEERISKIVEEYEENNKHGFDNRKGDKHVSGVYRWVDKIYKNRVVNYGKRLIYEFMIPEPSSFHNYAIAEKKALLFTDVLIKPIDPRIGDGKHKLANAGQLDASNYALWAAQYNAEVDAIPDPELAVGAAFNLSYKGEAQISHTEANAGNGTVVIPEGYYAVKATGSYEAVSDGDGPGGFLLSLKIGNIKADSSIARTATGIVTLSGDLARFVGEVPVSFTLGNYVAGDICVSVTCALSEQALEKWQNETFNAIISAYEAKLKEYNNKMAEVKSTQQEKVKSNPLFYRQIENMVLRKNCIEYLVGQGNLDGKDLFRGDSLQDTRVAYDGELLETYAARVKFFEEAFEWDIMSYYFYPFYWADRKKWQGLYNVDESDDQVFRSFLQSGMARVMLTVKPGFEEAVNWYMSTGQIWNGGQVPAVDDPMFVSIIEELRVPEGTVEGEWESRVPTTLTVIQAGTIGLEVEGLPCNPECDDNLKRDGNGNVMYDADGNPLSDNPIRKPDTPVVMGNITNELEDVTATLETMQDDIEQIKDALNIPGL